MTRPFSVRATPHFDRLVRALHKRHGELADRLAEALDILKADPYGLRREDTYR